MAANNAVVGILRAMLTADTASFDTGMRKAGDTLKLVASNTGKVGTELAKIAPQAERMIKSFQGDKMLYTANNLVTAITKVGGATKLTEAEQTRANRTLSEAISKYALLGQKAPQAMVDLERATRKMEQPTSFLTTKMVALGAAVGTFVSNLAFQGVRAIVGFGRDAFEAAGRITDLADKTGLSTTTIQRMEFVAKQTSTSLDAMTNAAFRLGVQIAGGSNSVKRGVDDLGLSFATIQRMRPDQQFEAIVGALSKVENQQERNRIGVLLFGRQFGEIAAAVEQGYQKMADAASVSSEAQLRALDKAADRWSQFVTNTKTNVTAFLGQIFLMADAMAEIEAEEQNRVFRGDSPDRRKASRDVEQLVEATRRVQLGLIGGRKEDIALTESQAKAEETYAQQLAAVQKELAGLTSAQRREIDAAQQLGVSTDDLETKYGLSEGALRLLNAQTKDYEKTLNSTAEAANKAASAQRAFVNFLGEREIEDAAAATKMLADALKEQESAATRHRQFVNMLGEQEITDHAAALKGQEDSDQRYRRFQNQLGEEFIAQEGERQKRLQEQGQRIVDFWKRQAGQLEGATIGRLGSLFFGGVGRDVGDDMRQFSTRWKAWTDGLKDTFEGALNEMLQHFLRSFIGGLIKGIVGARLGQTLGNALMGSVAGVAAGGGAAVIAGGSGAAAAVAGVESAALGGTAAGGGATLAALATNPWTIGAAGGIALGLLIAKKGLFRGGEERLVNPRRDQFTAQFGGGHQLAARLTGLSGEHGGGHLFAALQRANSVKEFEAAQSAIAGFLGQFKQRVKLFDFGGFVPPGVTQPAILHGGAFGEDVTPRIRSQSSAGPSLSMHNTFNISSIDARGVREFVESRDFLDSVSRVFEHNKGFIATRVRPSLVS